MKTDTVLFGEPIPPDVLKICQWQSDRCDCMLLVGTSAFVYPAAGFPRDVKMRDGSLIEVDPYETEISGACNVSLRGKAGEVLPELVKAVKAKTGKI